MSLDGLNQRRIARLLEVNHHRRLVGGALAMQTPYLASLPIPNASDADRAAIAALVQKCLDAKGVDCGAWEAEIDARVAALYGL